MRETSRRHELVVAAYHRVATVGFEGLRLRQVADDVGIDHSTLHHHMPTKQHLVTAVVEYTTRQFWTTNPPVGDPVARLRGHLDNLRRMQTERPELFIVTAELDLKARRDPETRAILERQEAGWRDGMVKLLTEGVANGAWDERIQPETTAELIIATVKGVRLAPHLAEAAFAHLIDLLTAKEH